MIDTNAVAAKSKPLTMIIDIDNHRSSTWLLYLRIAKLPNKVFLSGLYSEKKSTIMNKNFIAIKYKKIVPSGPCLQQIHV